MDPICDGRWQCAGCGRFVAESAIHSEDRIDPGAYYGVSSHTWAECNRCGPVDDPRLSVVGVEAAAGRDA